MFKLPEPSEAEIQRACIAYLDMKKIFWWRQNNGMAVYQDKNRGERRVKFGTEGASDLACLTGGDRPKGIRGTYVAIEIKRPSAS